MISTNEKITTSIIRTEKVVNEGNEYTYTLLCKESSKMASYRLPLYSIEVKMKDSEGNITESKIKDIFYDFGKAVVFYNKLVENLATPINLPYILEDEISYL